MLKNILEKIENQEMTISQWMLGFVGILFVRFIFETLSSPTPQGFLLSAISFVHIGLYFLTTALGLICIVSYFNKDYLKNAKLLLFSLPIIWIAPIVDIILSKGKGYHMSYIYNTGKYLLLDFFKFFSPYYFEGATYGIRVGIIIILISIGWFVWRERKNIQQTVLAVLICYIFLFIMGTLPSLLYTFSHFTETASLGSQNIMRYIYDLVTKSNIFYNTLHEGPLSVTPIRFLQLGFDKLLSQILFIISFIFGSIIFWKIDSKKFKSVLANMRPERIGSYIALLLCGAGFAYINKLNSPFNFIDLLGFVCLIISWISLWMYAVHTNDIADVKIDEISNKDRPIIKKDLNQDEMRETSYIWLSLALLGSWSAGFYPFFMSLVYLACSYIYSSPPLRLRRFPVVPSFLIGTASLATILAGFFFVSANKQIQTFPSLLALGIVIMVTLAINVKDMKDIEGDRADGILSLPVLFGENGVKIVGACLALAFLLVPIFLSFYALYIFSIPAAIVGYKLVTKKPYTEKPLFILRFVFLGCVALSYLGIYWLAYLYKII